MARKRLLNCDFINNGAYSKLTNKAKLLYIYMFANGDDKGFCDNTEIIINNLENAENGKSANLLEDNYKVALQELIDKDLLFVFVSSHNNYVYLIRHWFYHNQFRNGLYTTYYNYLQKVVLENNKYEWKKEETLKEDKLNESKINENKVNDEEDKEEDNELPFDYDYKGKGVE